MSYPSANQGYYGAAYGNPPDTDAVSSLPRNMTLAVVVLGLMSYGVSFGPMPEGQVVGWSVRFAVLATLLAGFGLLRGQKPHHKVVAVLAVAGFLEAFAMLLGGPGSGWVLTVIVVVNGIQSVAAIIGLLRADTEEPDSTAYEAYSEYWAQMARYYGQYPAAGESREDLHRGGQGQAEGQGVGQAAAPAVARAPRPAADQSAGYADLVGNQDPERTAIIDPVPAQTGSAGQSGLPSYGQAAGQMPVHGQDVQGPPETRPAAP